MLRHVQPPCVVTVTRGDKTYSIRVTSRVDPVAVQALRDLVQRKKERMGLKDADARAQDD
jgi:hypothetical protein